MTDELAPALPDGEPGPRAFMPALGGVHDMLADVRGADRRVARIRALIELGRAGDAKARPALEAVLGERDWVLRKYAVAALGQLADPASAAAVRGALSDARAEVRRAAARALRSFARPTGEWLALAGDADWHVRAVALEELAGRDEGTPALLAALEDPAWLNRWLAISGLSRRRDDHAALAPGLFAALDRDPAIAAHAAAALADWAAASSAIGEGLIARMAGAPAWKRLALAPALGKLDDEAARDALAGLIGHPDPEIEAAIAAHGAAMAVRVRAALGDPGWIRRWHACRLLGRLGDPANAVALLPAIADPRPEVRLAALEALRRLAAPDGLADIRAALADPSWRIRLAALEALAARADAAELPDLPALLADPRAEVRAAASRELSRLGRPAIMDAPDRRPPPC